jgi:hypothetical protein
MTAAELVKAGFLVEEAWPGVCLVSAEGLALYVSDDDVETIAALAARTATPPPQPEVVAATPLPTLQDTLAAIAQATTFEEAQANLAALETPTAKGALP